MDLVSSTLDRYLKHRFNGNSPIATSSDTKITENDIETPKIHRFTFSNKIPCCIDIRNDLKFIAAGYENSQIYIWTLNTIDEETIKLEDSDSKRFRLLGHTGPVYGIEFFNNDDLMLSCSEDTTIRLWCLKNKCNLNIYRGHSYPIWSVTLAPQGNFFASGSMDATARLWRLDKNNPLRILCGHDEDVECLQFHPNEKYIATGASDATVRLWSISDGKMVRLMVGHREPIISLSFLPSGKFLASASRDGIIKVWNLATNCTSREIDVSTSHTISFSPEQIFIASCGVDNTLRLWQINDLESVEKKIINLGKSIRPIKSHFSRCNKLLVISYEDKETSLHRPSEL